MADRPTAPLPRWLLPLGMLLLLAGVVGLVADLRSGGGVTGDAFGGFGIVIDLALDLFLVVAGTLVLLVVRAQRR